MHDRGLWRRWERDSIDVDRREFMFASYNAGEGTIMNAQRACVPTLARPAGVEQRRDGRARGASLALSRDVRLRAKDPERHRRRSTTRVA